MCELRPNSRATFSENAQVRVGKQLLAVKKSNPKNRQSCSLNKSQLTLSHAVLMKRKKLVMKMMMIGENQSS
jgi:hypothetical protein